MCSPHNSQRFSSSTALAVFISSAVCWTAIAGAQPVLDSASRQSLARVWISGCSYLYDSDIQTETDVGPIDQSVSAVFLSQADARQTSDLAIDLFHVIAGGDGYVRTQRSTGAGAWERSLGRSIYDITFTLPRNGTFTCNYDLVENGNGTSNGIYFAEVDGATLLQDSGTGTGSGGGAVSSSTTYRLLVRADADSCTNYSHSKAATWEFSFQVTLDPEPAIQSITDVGNDQGRQVRLVWQRCMDDMSGALEPVTGYAIFRRQDAFRKAIDPTNDTAAGWLPPLAGWDYLETVPAFGEDEYQCVVPTVCDSTVSEGMCWSTFLVRAMTADPTTFWDSLPDSGYSLDNLAPGAPASLHVPAANTLAWDEAPEPDFDYFTVYVADNEDFSDATVVGHTITPNMDITGTEGDYLAVTATDFAGNEGDRSVIVRNLTDVPDGGTTRFALHQNTPNPFNPMTRIDFSLARTAAVRLAIYDLNGQRVRTLVDGTVLPSGDYSRIWRGRDDTGRAVASGTYVYRLVSGGETAVRRLVLIR